MAYHAIGSLASKEDMLRAAIQRARELPRTGETVHVPESSCALTASHAPASRSTRDARKGEVWTPSVGNVEMFFMETRPLGRGSSQRAPWDAVGYRDYYTISAILNARYADRWSLPFEMARPVRQPHDNTYYGICKIYALEDKIAKLLAAGRAETWLMYLDSDAFVREHLVDVRTLLRRLEPQTRPGGSTHLLLTREDKYTDTVLPHPQPVNTGCEHWHPARGRLLESNLARYA